MPAKSCCCFDLRTGNIIIAWLDVLTICAVFTAQNGQSLLVYFFVGLLSLYAIQKERAEFLYPSLIVRGISIITFIIILVCIFAGYAIFATAVQDGKLDSDADAQEVQDFLQIFFAYVGIFIGILTAVECYFFYVILSFFKKMKAEALEKVQVAQFDNIERGCLYPKVNEQYPIKH